MKTAPSTPRERTVQAAETCTKEPWQPLFDTAAAGVGVANMVISANAAPGDVRWYGIEMDHEAGFALGVTQLVLYGAGAAYGYVQVARCAKLREKFADDPRFEAARREREERERAEGKKKEAPAHRRFGSRPEGTPPDEEPAEGLFDPKPASTDDDLFNYD